MLGVAVHGRGLGRRYRPGVHESVDFPLCAFRRAPHAIISKFVIAHADERDIRNTDKTKDGAQVRLEMIQVPKGSTWLIARVTRRSEYNHSFRRKERPIGREL